MNEAWFWTGWAGPLRIVVMGLLGYAFLILLLRSTGKRTLSKMNAFDFIVTIAIGSTFASVLLDERVSYAEGVAAFSVLVLMQYGVSWASSRSSGVESLVKSVPSVLAWRGELLPDAMRSARVTEAEILAACRQAGAPDLSEVAAVVLETAGEFSVLRGGAAAAGSPGSTLRTVQRSRDAGPDPRGS